jgi:protein subunit release factor A
MESIVIEIKAAEGGDDAKLLVEDMLGVYAKVAVRECL